MGRKLSYMLIFVLQISGFILPPLINIFIFSPEQKLKEEEDMKILRTKKIQDHATDSKD